MRVLNGNVRLPAAEEAMMIRSAETVTTQAWSRELEQRIRESVGAIRYGTVTLVIQDGKVIQIDRNEKIRLK